MSQYVFALKYSELVAGLEIFMSNVIQIRKMQLVCLLFAIAGCSQNIGENKLMGMSAPKESNSDANTASGPFITKEVPGCKNLKGSALSSCLPAAKVRCGEVNKKEYCIQSSDNSSARIWGPF